MRISPPAAVAVFRAFVAGAAAEDAWAYARAWYSLHAVLEAQIKQAIAKAAGHPEMLFQFMLLIFAVDLGIKMQGRGTSKSPAFPSRLVLWVWVS